MPEQSQSPTALSLTDSQLLRLIYSRWDFQQALSALTFLIEDCDFSARYEVVRLRRFRCFETSAIIAFCRPFEPGRGQTVVGLRAIGLRLTKDEDYLRKKLLTLRRQVIAHSDEEEMHFIGEVVQPLDDVPIHVPNFEFVEGLHLSEEEAHELEHLLRKLLHRISDVLMDLASHSPERLAQYRIPQSARPPRGGDAAA